jgi:hypothetical protein
MTTQLAPICVACKHFKGWLPDAFGGRCDAYPGPPDDDGIPRAIMLSQIDHRVAYRGDHGVTFTPAKKGDAEYPNLLFNGPPKSASKATRKQPKQREP